MALLQAVYHIPVHTPNRWVDIVSFTHAGHGGSVTHHGPPAAAGRPNEDQELVQIQDEVQEEESVGDVQTAARIKHSLFVLYNT